MASALVPTTKLGRPLRVSRPAWYGGGVLAVVAIITMLVLANWQYSRAKPHADLAVLAASRAEAAVPAAQVLGGATELDADMVGRRVQIDGRYLPSKQWLVPTPDATGTPGYLVLDVLEPTSAGTGLPASLLVVRGWVAEPQSADRPPGGDVRLTAWIGAPDGVSSTLTSAMPAGQLPEVSPARIASELVPPTLDGYLGLVESTPATTLTLPAEPMTAVHGSWSILNLGYAIQWVLFAIAVVVAWIMQVMRARQPAPAEATRADDQPETGVPVATAPSSH